MWLLWLHVTACDMHVAACDCMWPHVSPLHVHVQINVVFLVLVMISLIRSQLKKKRVRDDPGKKRELVMWVARMAEIWIVIIVLSEISKRQIMLTIDHGFKNGKF